MINPHNMSQRILASLVNDLVEEVWGVRYCWEMAAQEDCRPELRSEMRFTLAKEYSGADFVDRITTLLNNYDLCPMNDQQLDEEEPPMNVPVSERVGELMEPLAIGPVSGGPRRVRYLIIDLETGRLGSTTLFRDQGDAMAQSQTMDNPAIAEYTLPPELELL